MLHTFKLLSCILLIVMLTGISRVAAQSTCREPYEGDSAAMWNIYLRCMVTKQQTEIDLLKEMMSQISAAFDTKAGKDDALASRLDGIETENNRLGDRVELLELRSHSHIP